MQRYQKQSWRTRRPEDAGPGAASEKIVRLSSPRRETEDGNVEAALDLVYQAAEIMQQLEADAAEMEARARSAIDGAAGKLEAAERAIRAAEAERLAAEERVDELGRRAEAAEAELEETQRRLAVTETQLCAMHMRVSSAEARALEAKQALMRIEDAIRTHILAKSDPRTAAA